MDGLLQDFKYALRTLARSPGFTFAAVLMLAVSIGANTALFSVLEEAVLAEPPFLKPDRLVVVDNLFGGGEGSPQVSNWSYPRYRALVDDVESLVDVAAYALRTMTLTELGNPSLVGVETVTPSLFPLLGVGTVVGRAFGPDEVDQGAASLVALVSYDFWVDRMGADPGVIGAALTLDRVTFNVLGVLQPEFDGLTGGAELWIPVSALREVENNSLLDDPWNQTLNLVARLETNTTFERARTEVQAFGSTIMERFPPPAAAARLVSAGDLLPYGTARVNPVAEASMLALFGAVVLVLLVAAANLAGLMLARGAARQKEAAVRASLGAGRSRMVRQLLTESLVLAFIGGLLGIGVAWMGIDVLGQWLTEAVGTGGGRGLEYLDPDNLSLDWRVLGFAFVLTGGVGIGFGLLPAWQAAHTDPALTLKSGGASLGSGPSGLGLPGSGALVVVQVGVALVLLAGASLMMRSLANLQRVDVGYDSEGLLTALYGLSPTDQQAGTDPAVFHLDFLDRVSAIPGVEGAALGEVPLAGPIRRTIVMAVEGRPELTPADHTWLRVQHVAGGYLDVLGANLVEGRGIEPGDRDDTESVVVINRTARDYLFPDGNAIGGKFTLGGLPSELTVVGVVEDIKYEEEMGLPPERQGFIPMRQSARLDAGLLVRTQGDPAALATAVRSALADLNPNLALTSMMTMSERSESVTARPRVVSILLSVFAAVAVFLVAVGLYGTIAFSVARRTRELGLRASLGAGRGTLLWLVLQRGLGTAVVGIAVGLVGASWATRSLEALLFDVETLDPLTLGVASALLFLVALGAAYLPARRAMRIDPMEALRAE